MEARFGPVVVALGANTGARERTIARAIAAMTERGLLAVEAQAPLYESPPMYVTDQPAFLNTVVVGRTDLSPKELIDKLKSLEEELGRKPTFQNGPRAIDLDIVLFGEQVVSIPDLRIPHPRLAERRFVLQPLCDVCPDLIHPVTGRSMRNLLEALGPAGAQDATRPYRPSGTGSGFRAG